MNGVKECRRMSVFHSGIEPARARKIYEGEGARLHFIGAGGVGMHPLARLALRDGKRVTGYDAKESNLTSDLVKNGADIRIGKRRESLSDVDLVVYTLAAQERDEEISMAERQGIPMLSRAELLGVLMTDYKGRLGVSGSHGKSTVTAMLDAIATRARVDQTTVVGANLFDTGLPIRLGGRELLIYEGCEYKDSFLRFAPTAAVYTSLELDHTDYFKDMEALVRSFEKSIRSCPRPVICLDDERLSGIAAGLKGRFISYGKERGDITAKFERREKGRYSIKIRHASAQLPEIPLKVAGKYNAENALSAAALALSAGFSEEEVCEALIGFSGVERRMQYIGRAGDFSLFYDYAHHPTEIKAAINGIRESEERPVTVIFKPHTFSRTLSLLPDFAAALSLADRVILLEIDPVREENTGRVSSRALASRISCPTVTLSDTEALSAALTGNPSSVVLMGAGDVFAPLSEMKSRVEAR